MIDRAQAWQILCEFTKSESLRKHALAVEACVVAYARKFGEDERKWSVTALLHDFDWEIHTQAPDHPMKGEPILAERGVPEEIRRAIYTTNVVESLHMTLRKVIKTRASFPSEESALKLLYLALQNVSKRWKPAPNWRTALNHFTLLYGDRMEAAWNRPAR